MPTPTETAQFIEERLSAPLHELETLRMQAVAELKRKRRWLRIYTLIGFLTASVVLPFFGFFLGLIVAPIAYFVVADRQKKRFFPTEAGASQHSAMRERLKREVIAPLVAHLAPGASYDPQGYLPQRDFAASRLFQVTPVSYTGDDLVTGVHGDVDIRFSELNVETMIQMSDGKKERKTAFKGMLFVADFHKDFHGLTVVRPRPPKATGLLRTYFSSASQTQKATAGMAFAERMMALPWTPHSMEFGFVNEVELEDPEFMEHFVVYSSDQIEARYILSPSMMRRLLEVRQGVDRAREASIERVYDPGKLVQSIPMQELEHGRFYVSFSRSNVYLAKHHWRDLFEVTYDQPLTDPRRIEQYANDLRLALEMVDELNLNTRIWSKAPAAR